MNEIQKIELDMLLEVDQVCKKLGIHYFIVGGTLLGAVRHKGFIPWDDDIDVGMLRADYETFVHRAQELLPAGSFLQTRFTDPELPCCFAKVRKDGTTFIETSMKDLRIHHGIYVDVFPFDYYPQNRVLAKINDIRLILIAHRVNEAFYSKEKAEYSLRGRIAHILSGLLYRDVKSALAAKDRICRSVSQSALITNYNGAWGEREIVPAEWVTRYTELAFEGHMVKAPAAYDAYLKHLYGNYMELPPAEKRVTHHYTEAIDTQRPYTVYLNHDQ